MKVLVPAGPLSVGTGKGGRPKAHSRDRLRAGTVRDRRVRTETERGSGQGDRREAAADSERRR